ncbi:MAG: tetratricopeptide repeat protein [Archaeoglobaceae archaeon]
MESLERFRFMRILLEMGFDRAIAEEVSEKIERKDLKIALSEYETFGRVSEKTLEYIKSKFLTKNVSELLFGVKSEIEVFPKITKSLIGSGKHGLDGLRDHLKSLGFSEEKFEEILLAFYWKAKGLSMLEKDSKKILALICLELGDLYVKREDKKAEKFLNEAFELREEFDENSAKSLAENFKKLAGVLERRGNEAKAEKVLEKSFIIAKELFENLRINDADYANTLIEIGEYYAKKKPEKAVSFFESALKFENAIPDRVLEVYDNLIQCYRETENYEKAQEYELRRKILAKKKKSHP